MAAIKLKGDTSGEITISAPAVAGTNTLTIPASTGNILTDGQPLPAIDGSALTNLGDNTPSFKVQAISGTNISNATWTKVTMGTKIWDTDTAFDLSNSRFTVPAGKTGKYQFNFRVKMSGIDDNEYIRAHLYKNGTRVEGSGNEFHSPGNDLQVPSQGFYAMSLVAGDYIELWCYHNEGGTRTMFGGTTEMDDHSYLQVVRLIGV